MKDLFPQIGNERLDFQFVMKDFKIDKTKIYKVCLINTERL